MKKILVWVLSIMVIFTMLPGISLTAFAEDAVDYKLNVCPGGENPTSVSVTSANMNDVLDDDGSVVYTPATDSTDAVLTLTNADLTYIQAADDAPLHIVLNGENSFYVPEGKWAFCINLNGDLEISGTGTATLKNDFYNPDDPNENFGYPCIMTENDLTIREATINAESKAGTNAIYCIGNMKICDGANVEATTDNYPSLWSAVDMTITDSSVKANAPNGNGIWTDGALTIDGTSDVTVTSGRVALGAGAGMEIKDQAKVSVHQSINGLINDGTGDISISGSAEVDINSTLNEDSFGIWNVRGGALNISGGTVSVYGKYYASVTKPNLTDYSNVAVFAGASADDATFVSDPEDTNYHTSNKYVKICSGHFITFDANNGTGNTCSKFADKGSLTLTDNVFTYGKCKIESWNTEPDGSGERYNAVGEINGVSEDITLYAQWVLPLNEQESFTLDGYEWSGNTSSPYNFTMKNGTKLYASVMFPLKTGEDKAIITVNGDCEITGEVTFSDDTYNASDLTIKGNGTLKFLEMNSTGSGDTLTVETDVTIVKDINIGASGGMNSKVVIKDATLTLNGRVVLLQYLTMEGNAKLKITNGTASFHSDPEIKLSDKSEIYINGIIDDEIDDDERPCALYKESGSTEAFDALYTGGWLPEGYRFEDSGCFLYDNFGHIATGPIIIKKPSASPKSSSGGGTTRYTVQFNTNGGSTIANKFVTRNSELEEPTAPTKDGFKFDGWYTDEELTTVYDFDNKVTESFTLYAKWAKHDDKSGTSDTECDGTIADNCPSLAFDDLDVKAWYHLNIDYVLNSGLMIGTGEKVFAPNDNLTRAMLVTVLYRVEGEPATNRSIPFADVDMGAYYGNAVSWAKQNGIVKGISETEFAPNDNITREQIAAILYRYAIYKGMDAVVLSENLGFKDADNISEYAISAMNWAVGKGLIKGYEDNTVRPQNNATRAEAAALLHRFIETNK